MPQCHGDRNEGGEGVPERRKPRTPSSAPVTPPTHALSDLESNSVAVGVASPSVVHGDDRALDARKRRRDRIREVGRERGDPTLPREVVSKQRYAMNCAGVFFLVHASPSALTAFR